MQILNNPWVTGIGGGTISSLIVFFITRYILRKRENKEYNQKIETANNEIIHTIRPLIVENKIPSKHILSSIIQANSKKYNVKKEDLYNQITLSDDLINELMTNSFLSPEQKMNYCECINKIKDSSDKNSSKLRIKYDDIKSQSTTTYTSFIVAVMTGMLAVVTTFYTYLRNSPNFTEKISLFILVMIFPILLILMTSYIKNIKEKKSIENEEKIFEEKFQEIMKELSPKKKKKK